MAQLTPPPNFFGCRKMVDKIACPNFLKYKMHQVVLKGKKHSVANFRAKNEILSTYNLFFRKFSVCRKTAYLFLPVRPDMPDQGNGSRRHFRCRFRQPVSHLLSCKFVHRFSSISVFLHVLFSLSFKLGPCK